MTYTPPQELDQGAFGETITAEIRSFFQYDFPYPNISTSDEQLNKTVVGSATIGGADSKLIVKTGTTTGSSAVAETRRFANYNPGQGVSFRVAGFFVNPTAGTTMELGIGDANDGFFFEYNGTDFGVNRRQNGTNNRVTQANWNLDKADGNGVLPAITTWNLGIPFQIRYQFLGYGAITWFVENPTTGKFVPVHREAYANTAQVPSVFNPSFPGRIAVDNGATTADVGVRISSIAAFNDGERVDTGAVFAAVGGQTVTTGANVLSIRNPATVDGITNRAIIKLIKASFSSDGTKIANFAAYRDATLGGSPSFATVTPNSIAEISNSNVTLTGGIPVDGITLAKSGSEYILFDKEIFSIFPGETWTFAANSASSSDVAVALTWQENL